MSKMLQTISTFKEYRLIKGLYGLDVSPEQINQAKVEYRRLYQKQYYQNRKQKLHIKKVSLTLEDLSLIQTEANRYGLSVNKFLREATKTYIAKTEIQTPHPDLSGLILAIRRIGTNVNQIAKHANTYPERLQNTDIENCLDHIKQLEETIKSYLNTASDGIQTSGTTRIRAALSKILQG